MPDSAATAASAPGGGVPVGPPIAFLGTADPAMATCLVEADISRMRERKCPQRVSGALPIRKDHPDRKEHPEMVGESIVQILLFASIVLCTLGSAVPVYGCIHPGKSSSRPVERNEPYRCAREAR